jgi:DNA-directed RNA polymerase specialized sigma24 family protein
MSAGANFPETIWSDVLEAADRTDPERARTAVLRLCERYHGAIQNWFHGRLLTRTSAADLTQEFLAGWLRREAPLGDFRRGERRFREFLSTCLRRFAASQHVHDMAAKRGGGVVHVTLEGQDGLTVDTPDPCLDLGIARQIHGEVVQEVTIRWLERVGTEAWPRLRDMALGIEPAIDYPTVGRDLGVPVGTIKGWVFRLRNEHYEGFLRRARAISLPGEATQEARHLLGLLVRHGFGNDAA